MAEKGRPPEELAPLPRSIIPMDVEGTDQGQTAHEWRMRVYVRDIAFSLRLLTSCTPELTLGLERRRDIKREAELPENPADPRAVDDVHDRFLKRSYLRDIAVSLRTMCELAGAFRS